MIQQSQQKHQYHIQCQADLSERQLTDTVIEQSDHVKDRHQCSSYTDYHRAIVNKVQKLQILLIEASSSSINLFGEICYDQYSEVVHLCGDAEGIDQSLKGAFMLRHAMIQYQRQHHFIQPLFISITLLYLLQNMQTIPQYTPISFHPHKANITINEHVVNMPKIIRFIYPRPAEASIQLDQINKIPKMVEQKGRYSFGQIIKDIKTEQKMDIVSNKEEKKTKIPKSISLVIKQKVGLRGNPQISASLVNNKLIQGQNFRWPSHITITETISPLTCDVFCCTSQISNLAKSRPSIQRVNIFSQPNNAKQFQQLNMTCEKSQNSNKTIQKKQRRKIFMKEQKQVQYARQVQSQLDVPPLIAQSWAKIQKEQGRASSNLRQREHQAAQ